MSLPMVHLAVAYNWRSDDKNFKLHDDPDFYLGAISPDAIHARRDSTRDDKHKTHLDVSRGNYGRIVERFWDSVPQRSPRLRAPYTHDRVLGRVLPRTLSGAVSTPRQGRADQYYNDTDQWIHALRPAAVTASKSFGSCSRKARTERLLSLRKQRSAVPADEDQMVKTHE